MPILRPRRQCRGRQRRNERPNPIRRLRKPQPPMRRVHVRHKRVDRGPLVRGSQPRKEERRCEDWEGRLPAVEGVGGELGDGADDKRAAGAVAGCYVGDGEGAEDPAGEVYEVGCCDEEGADSVGWLDVGD